MKQINKRKDCHFFTIFISALFFLCFYSVSWKYFL